MSANSPTLILNKSWQAVGVQPVSSALSKVCNERARIVDHEDYSVHTWESWCSLPHSSHHKTISSPKITIRVPEVIVLSDYSKVPSQAVTFTRRNVFRRDKYRCQYCGSQPGTEELTIDHVLPRAQGGVSSWENCALACVSCNFGKADRTPEQAGMKLLSTPRRPTWKPLYSARGKVCDSWSKFISESYWNAELEE